MKHILCVSQPKKQTMKTNTNKKMYLMPDSAPPTTSTGASDDGNSVVIVIVDKDGEYIDTTKLSSKIKYPAILMQQRITQGFRGHIR
jgi:glycine cleavage system protein P-like pyridoxal-binding family